MALIEWNKALYGVDVARFDEDHKKLLDFINQLHESMLQGKGKEKLTEILVALQQYTRYHFAEEEKEMRNVGYPDVEAHIQLHQTLTDQLGKYISDFENNKREVSIETFRFLKEWLFNHIQVADKKYVPWMKAKQSS